MVAFLNSDVYKDTAPKINNYPSAGSNNVLSFFWVLAGILTVAVPYVSHTMKANNYQSIYEMYNWEEVQEQYQQQQQEYMENMEEYYMDQYYNNGGYNYNWQEMRGNYDLNQCKWWQVNCYPYYINEEGEPVPQAGWYPKWFSGWTQTQEEREEMLENGETSTALKFVYVWQMIMFIGVLIYGIVVIRQNRIVSGITVALVVFANMAFLSMWMLADGSILTDGDQINRLGFYGQFSVLMFMTNFWYLLFGIVFSIVFMFRYRRMHGAKINDDTNNAVKNAEGKGGAVDAEGNYEQLPDDSPKAKRTPVPVWAQTD